MTCSKIIQIALESDPIEKTPFILVSPKIPHLKSAASAMIDTLCAAGIKLHPMFNDAFSSGNDLILYIGSERCLCSMSFAEFYDLDSTLFDRLISVVEILPDCATDFETLLT